MSINLHQVVSGAIGSINSFTPVVVKRATGYVTSEDGTQLPTYNLISISAQIQAMSGTDILRMNELNIQGVMKKAYINGPFEAIERGRGQGGDLFIFCNQVWLVEKVLENWGYWTAVALVLQLDSAANTI